MRLFLSIILGKLVAAASSLLNLGAGSTWPGHLALKIETNFVKNIFKKNSLKVIVVAGTNGKTTSTALISHLLRGLGYRVFSNPEGANLMNGVTSALLKTTDFSGNLDYDFAVLEVDEFTLPLLLKEIVPDAVFILNLFRDQLDRYGEVNTIGSRWFSSLETLPKKTFVVVNGDDPYLYFMGKKLHMNVKYFGVDEKLMELKNIPHDVDFIYCPSCNTLLNYSRLAYSHLGVFNCGKCGFKRKDVNNFSENSINYPMEGLYNVYNTNGILTFFKYFLKADLKKINSLLKKFRPAFGRQELIEFQKRKIFLLLSKNPAGFNQSIRTVKSMLKNNTASFLIVLNDRIPDGQDVSWIWDVDFSILLSNVKKIFVSGDRVYDMSIRLKYENKTNKIYPVPNLQQALTKIIENTRQGEKFYILATYSGMLEIRKILLGKKFL